MSLCDRHVCRNNASCVPDITNLDNYQCQCTQGYHGPTCELKMMDFCGSGGVGNDDVCTGGECVWTSGGPKCLCQYGRMGRSCLIGLSFRLLASRVMLKGVKVIRSKSKDRQDKSLASLKLNTRR